MPIGIDDIIIGSIAVGVATRLLTAKDPPRCSGCGNEEINCVCNSGSAPEWGDPD